MDRIEASDAWQGAWVPVGWVNSNVLPLRADVAQPSRSWAPPKTFTCLRAFPHHAPFSVYIGNQFHRSCFLQSCVGADCTKLATRIAQIQLRMRP